jgi:hypothetical protein
MSGTNYTQTPNYALFKPVPNADADAWGGHLNTNADTLDSALHSIATQAAVLSFNTRAGAVTLSYADVTTVLAPATVAPLVDGMAAAGVGNTWARSDHVHPSDTTRAPLASPAFTGIPTAPTAAPGINTTQLATTAFVAATALPRAGVTDGSNAAAGQIGEYISQTVLVGAAVPLASGVTSTVTTISLTAGDWDVSGNVAFQPVPAASVTAVIAGISLGAVFATEPSGGAIQALIVPFTTGQFQTLLAGTLRVSVAATTTVYLLAQGTFSGGTCGAYGFIGARRRR